MSPVGLALRHPLLRRVAAIVLVTLPGSIACLRFVDPVEMLLARRGTATLASNVKLTWLAEGVWMHSSVAPSSEPSAEPTNGLLIYDDEGLTLVDAAASFEQTAAVVDWATSQLFQPLKWAIITHRPDVPTKGLDALRARGIRPYGHASVVADRPLAFDERGRATVGGVVVYYPGPSSWPGNVVVRSKGGALFVGCLARSMAARPTQMQAEQWKQAILRVRGEFPDESIIVPCRGERRGRSLFIETMREVEALLLHRSSQSAVE